MSSSSSLAAARRRRAGGAPTNVPPSQLKPPTNNTSTKPNTQESSIPPNPLMILQQHHLKISSMEENIKNLMTTSLENKSGSDSLNMTEITDKVMERIEQQMDLRVFYENDTRLAGEIESLKTLVSQQHLLINDLNKLLYFIVGKLNLEYSPEKTSTEPIHINEGISEANVELNVSEKTPTFPKSVTIDISNNEEHIIEQPPVD
jgi:hypothetical protein